MRKLFSLIVAMTFCLGLFAGCGYAAGTDVTGIAFTSKTYYLDLNVATDLEYKILPSTASSYEPKIDFIGQPENRRKISRVEGTISKVRVTDETFTGIEVSISYSTGSGTRYEDTCNVVLKQYPQFIDTQSEKVYISNKGIAHIPFYGMFNGESRVMDNSIYKTVVKSSDETVVSVESQENVVVKSTGKQGKATVTIEVVASDGSKIGDDGLKTSVEVVVTNPVSDCVVFGSKNNGVSSQPMIYRNILNMVPELHINSASEYHNIEPILVDKDGYIVENVSCMLTSLNEDVAKIKVNNDGTFDIVPVGNGETEILISSDGYGEDGMIKIFKINLVVNY